MALIAMRVPDEQRTSVLTMSLLPLQFSWFLGPVIGALLSRMGLGVVFLAGAALMVLAALPAATLLRWMEVRESRPEEIKKLRPEPIRRPYNTRSDSRTVAAFRPWRGWQVCAA